MTIPTVSITVSDNGANVANQIPQQNVQVVMGCSVAGTAAVPVATTNPNTIQSTFTAGPLVEAAGLVTQAGGTVIAMRLTQTAAGTATAVVPVVTGGSTCVLTLTLDGTVGAYDDYYVRILCTYGGTRGTTGIQFKVSLDAGRNYGSIVSLGTATTYVISGTGITVNIAAGTMVAGDYWSFSTTAPAWDSTSLTAAITALANSAYGVSGWGSMHLVGVASATIVANAQTYLEALTGSKYIYSRTLASTRDALAPVAWGGSGETETTWITSLQTAFSATNAKRVTPGAGYYNMPSVYPNSSAGLPSYRRPLAWADAVRRVLVPPQRRGGRVKDGSLSNIIVNPASDPSDGFIYHDERANPGLDASRFMSAITWPKKQGFFICHENLMAQVGSQFTDLTLGNVIDVACDIAYATAVDEIGSDLQLQANGTLFPTDAIGLQNTINSALATFMTNVAMVSSATAVVDQSVNVAVTNNIVITVTVQPRGYVNSITETINLSTTAG